MGLDMLAVLVVLAVFMFIMPAKVLVVVLFVSFVRIGGLMMRVSLMMIRMMLLMIHHLVIFLLILRFLVRGMKNFRMHFLIFLLLKLFIHHNPKSFIYSCTRSLLHFLGTRETGSADDFSTIERTVSQSSNCVEPPSLAAIRACFAVANSNSLEIAKEILLALRIGVSGAHKIG
jgi:hypothetical protein